MTANYSAKRSAVDDNAFTLRCTVSELTAFL